MNRDLAHISERRSPFFQSKVIRPSPRTAVQRLASGIAFIDARTDELVGIWPSNGGHHDCVIVPTELEHLKHTRSCTL